MKIIGFGHKKRVGKDQAVKFAITFARQHFPKLNTQIFSFGDELKAVAYRMYQWGGLEEGIYYENHPEQVEAVLAPIGKSPRQIWDSIGLMGRQICEVTWPEAAMYSQLSLTGAEPDVLFCKDVRFPTEIDLIRKFKGYAFRIDRPRIPAGGIVDQALNSYVGWSGIIKNDSGLRDFNKTIKTLTASILNGFVETTEVICQNCFGKEPYEEGPKQFKCRFCSTHFQTDLYREAV